MIIGRKKFDLFNRTYIMGILNITPDSFSDGGKFNHIDAALKHAERMIDEGADLLDIGGESSRPGHTRVDADEEIARVLPVIEAIKARFAIPVSVDTCKSQVACAAIAAGADLINDIWGLKFDAHMAEVIAKSGVACCLMHNRKAPAYNDFLCDFSKDIDECLALAAEAGVADEQIILDPGVGFAKTVEQNLQIIKNTQVLAAKGFPMLLGTSRKSFIGAVLDLPLEQRLEGTLATTALAVQYGYSFVRVHDVKENKRIIQMTEAILAGKKGA